MGRVTKIETLNLQSMAIDLKAKGMTDIKIGQALTKKAGTPISKDIEDSE